jgi:hypothetical protein
MPISTYAGKEYTRRLAMRKELLKKGYSDAYLRGLKTNELEELIKSLK